AAFEGRADAQICQNLWDIWWITTHKTCLIHPTFYNAPATNYVAYNLHSYCLQQAACANITKTRGRSMTSPRLHHFINATLITTLLSSTGTALAEQPPTQATTGGLPAAPGISVMGLTGDSTAGYGDLMFPLLGRSTRFFHLNPQLLFN